MSRLSITLILILFCALYSKAQGYIGFKRCYTDAQNSNYVFCPDSLLFTIQSDVVIRMRFFGRGAFVELLDKDTLFFDMEKIWFIDTLKISKHLKIPVDSNFQMNKETISLNVVLDGVLISYDIEMLIMEGEYYDGECIMYSTFYWHPILGIVKFTYNDFYKQNCTKYDDDFSSGMDLVKIYSNKAGLIFLEKFNTSQNTR